MQKIESTLAQIAKQIGDLAYKVDENNKRTDARLNQQASEIGSLAGKIDSAVSQVNDSVNRLAQLEQAVQQAVQHKVEAGLANIIEAVNTANATNRAELKQDMHVARGELINESAGIFSDLDAEVKRTVQAVKDLTALQAEVDERTRKAEEAEAQADKVRRGLDTLVTVELQRSMADIKRKRAMAEVKRLQAEAEAEFEATNESLDAQQDELTEMLHGEKPEMFDKIKQMYEEAEVDSDDEL